ncbi:hypothetical protein [Roseivirga sp. UBA1976]|uniref:hypothetical protein n=1 Tax=Roseivirga sp. UBA1976 TaxID=1947386 RepID=UPI00257DEFA3|nr:hypothetical protein [Roseivirga sp. UBA1976]|tara:strand:+ start:9028 stop:9900 length:873 start_codon:yes stop_codon:yes gene_type:complete
MRTRILFLPLIIALLFASCHKDDVVVLSEPNIPLPEGISEALAFELLVHQVESTTLNVLHSLSERDRGAANTHINFNIFSDRGTCGGQFLDTSNNQLLLSFGEGCIDGTGYTLKGSILLDYDHPADTPGNTIRITLTDFELNNISLNGVLELTNTSENNSDTQKSYRLEFDDLTLTLRGKSTPFEGSRNIQYEKTNGRDHLDTKANYLTSNSWHFTLPSGTTFELINTGPNLSTFSCWLHKVYLPARGSLQVDNGETTLQIDLNTNACDFLFYWQSENGIPVLHDLRESL